MATTPEGKRPRGPGIAAGVGSASSSRHAGDDYTGTTGTKTPTGNRPVPPIPADHAPPPKAKNAARPAAKHTPMPVPPKYHRTDKAHGGGGGY